MIDDLERIYDELFAETGWAEISVALVMAIDTWPVAVRGAPTDALPDDHGNQIRALTEIVGLYQRLETDLINRRIYLPGLKLPRMRIFHNPDAVVPLPHTFAGAHDEQWDTISVGNGSIRYGPVAYGRESWEWLRLT